MKNNIKILVIGIITVLLLIPSIGAIQTGDSGFMYYVFGDNTVTPVFVFNQSGNDSMLYVDDDGLYVQNHINNWFRITGNDSVGGDGGFDYSSWFNQKLNTSDSVAHSSIFVNGLFTDMGNIEAILYNLNTTIGLSSLTSGEVDQLENIGSNTITAGQWGYLSNLDQDVHRTSDPTFDDVTMDDLDCQDIDVDDSVGDSDIRIKPTEGNEARITWYGNSDADYWELYLNENTYSQFTLNFHKSGIGGGDFESLQSSYSIIDGAVLWAFGGATPSYGITQGTANLNHDKGYAHTWVDASDPLIKEVFDIPLSKLRQFYNAVNIIGYYNKNHYWNENGDLIIGATDYSCFEVGCDALELKNSLENIFGDKVVNSFIYERDMGNQTLMGICYRNLQMTLIKALMEYIDSLENRILLLEQEVFG